MLHNVLVLYIKMLCLLARLKSVDADCSMKILKTHTLRWHVGNSETPFAFAQVFSKK